MPARRQGDLLFIAGQLPFVDGRLPRTGKLGDQLDVPAGQVLARQCALNALRRLEFLMLSSWVKFYAISLWRWASVLMAVSRRSSWRRSSVSVSQSSRAWARPGRMSRVWTRVRKIAIRRPRSLTV